jgi:hypothetical protein
MKLGKYKHYKGNIYEVLFVGLHSDTHEEMVVYRGLYDSEEFGNNPIWIKSVSGFMENVSVGDKEILRFEYLEE